MNATTTLGRWMRGISLAALAAIAACSADDPEQATPVMRPPSHLAVHLSLASDGTVGVVSTTVTSSTEQTTAHSAEALTYTFRTSSGTMLANGTVDDPRPVHAEWFENGEAQRAEAIQPFSSLVLNLPARRGIVEFTDANGIAVGRTEVVPPTNAAPPGSVVQQLISPATDVIGSPVKVVDHGSSDAAFDLLFLPEGYTQAQLEQFHRDVDRVVSELFARPDYARHAHRFNVWRIDVRSANSGVSSAAPAAMIDTAFAIRRYAPDGEPLARLFVSGDSRGMAAARELGMRVNAEATFIIANTSYGGSGGEIGVASNDSALTNVIAHELGHSILHLADEYSDAVHPERTLADCSGSHPTAVNVSYSSDRASLPWADLVPASATLPSTDLTSSAVGAYLGGDRCPYNRYRPTPHCLMNRTAESFCPVCQRAMDTFFARYSGGEPTGTSTGTGTGTGSDPGTGTGSDPGTGTGSDPGTGTGTGTGSDPGTGTGTGSDPTPSCRYTCDGGYVPGQCYGGWACNGACLEYTGCTAAGSSSGSSGSSGSGSSGSGSSGSGSSGSGSSGSAGTGTTPSCTYTCASRGYAEGQCYMGYLCESGCITYTGCSDGSSSGGSSDSGSAGTGTGSTTCEYWTCAAYDYQPGTCVDHYYCDGNCIIPNGC